MAKSFSVARPDITPHSPTHTGPGLLSSVPKTFSFVDNSVVVYPKLPNGKSCRVVIIRRTLTSSHGAKFHVCRNCGKWSYKIDYPLKNETTRMTKSKFISELTRMGGEKYIGSLLLS